MGGNITGENFLGGNFPGVDFPGGSLMGGNFPGGNFLGGSFPRTYIPNEEKKNISYQWIGLDTQSLVYFYLF